VYAALVGAHLAFRLAYYGELLPNTYYAKLDGRLSWGSGLAYLEAFALEYSLWLQLPLWAAGVAWHRSRGTLRVPALFAAVCLPHALYVASLGGDHFEYRPLDLYLPFAALLATDGVLYLARGWRWGLAAGAWLALVVLGLVELPLRSHAEFPPAYLPGFPGLHAQVAAAREFLRPEEARLFSLPGLRELAARHRARLDQLSARFVGLRQEEHVGFLAGAQLEGELLAAAVREGRLPPDTHVAICCVGAIPYLSGLRTLDRHGLTDRTVARGEPLTEFMGHAKQASLAYARARGVDLWAVHPAHLLWRAAPPLADAVRQLKRAGVDAHFAELGPDLWLLVHLPQGVGQARARFPRLELRSVRDSAAVRELEARLRAAS
jgi:hypothetical protein